MLYLILLIGAEASDLFDVAGSTLSDGCKSNIWAGAGGYGIMVSHNWSIL